MPCSKCNQNGHNKSTCKSKSLVAVLLEARAARRAPEPPAVAPEPPAVAPEPPAVAPEPPVAPDASALSGVVWLPKPEPVVRQETEPPSLDLDTVLNIIMTKLNSYNGNTHAINLLKMLYRADPTKFKVWGGVHTNEEGTLSYFSVRFYYNDKGMYDTLHFNGAVRGSKFIVKSASYKCWGQTTEWSYEKKML
jgi:hypothetical protein